MAGMRYKVKESAYIADISIINNNSNDNVMITLVAYVSFIDIGSPIMLPTACSPAQGITSTCKCNYAGG